MALPFQFQRRLAGHRLVFWFHRKSRLHVQRSRWELAVAWNTAGQIAPGQGADAYGIRAVRVTLTSEPDATWPVDTTADEWFTYDQNQDGFDNADHIPRRRTEDTIRCQ